MQPNRSSISVLYRTLQHVLAV